jgi:hypothetical protein
LLTEHPLLLLLLQLQGLHYCLLRHHASPYARGRKQRQSLLLLRLLMLLQRRGVMLLYYQAC